MSHTTYALLGSVLGIGGALVAIASRYLPRPNRAHTTKTSTESK